MEGDGGGGKWRRKGEEEGELVNLTNSISSRITNILT